MTRRDAAQQTKEAEPARPHRCDIRSDRTLESKYPHEGRTPIPDPQATAWLHEDAIPGGGEEHRPDYDVVCVGQSENGTQVIAKSVRDAAYHEPKSGLVAVFSKSLPVYRRCRRQVASDRQNPFSKTRCADGMDAS
jgi:hypothetical protein